MSLFKIVRDGSVESFLEKASQLLYRDEPANSLMIGLCEGMIAVPPKNPPLLIRILKEDEAVSAAIQTPPMNLVISHGDRGAMKALAEHLRRLGADFPGVVGPAAESEFFANEWSTPGSRKSRLGMGQKIYKLEKVRFPKEMNGSFRVASAEDSELVFDWIIAFAKESLPSSDQRDEAHWREFARSAIRKQAAHLWIHEDHPVSIAFASRPTRNGVSINGVYTPPKCRKNGFASAVVAHLSQKMLDSGKHFCVLYTDLSNPTSNRIYQDIGYREVSDSKHFLFE